MIDTDKYPKDIRSHPLALLPPTRNAGHEVIEAASQGFLLWKGDTASNKLPVPGPELVKLKMNKIHI